MELLNSPRSFAIPARTRPVPLLVTLMAARGTMAPVSSATVTLIVPGGHLRLHGD